MTEHVEEPGRRSLLVMLATYAALTVLVALFSFVAGALRLGRSGSSRVDPDAIAFLGPLAQGTRFDGWRILRVETPRGACMVLELESDAAEKHAVDVCARAPSAPAGIAETPRLAIYLRAGRSGAETPPSASRACAALATALTARETAGFAPPALPSLAAR